MFLAREFQRDGVVFQQLMRLAVEFSQELRLGYTNAVVQVSSSEYDFVRLLRQDGFLRVGTLQSCVKIAGKGLCDSVLLAKRLPDGSRPVSIVNSLTSRPTIDYEIDWKCRLLN